MNLPVDLKLDANQAMETVGAWVAALVARWDSITDKKMRQAVPRLASKLAHQSGLNIAFGAALEETPFDSPQMKRAEEKLRELRKGMKEVLDLLKSIDPQFGSAHTDLVASLAATVTIKDNFLWKATNGNLLNPAFRAGVAEGMHSQANKLKQASDSLSAAAAATNGTKSTAD